MDHSDADDAPIAVTTTTPTWTEELDHSVYLPSDGAGSKYVEMLMRYLPDGALLYKIVTATASEIWDDPLPVVFGTEVAARISPETFCCACKVHLGLWDAFHGGVIETGGNPPVRVCSNRCLMEMIEHPSMVPEHTPAAFAAGCEILVEGERKADSD